MEFSFLDLKCKEVVNLVDGKRLGNVSDVVLDMQSGRIVGFVVPVYKKGFNLFKNSDDVFFATNQIAKIGEDAILVELYSIKAPTDGRIASISGRTTQLKDEKSEKDR